jgi:hypothetical protein
VLFVPPDAAFVLLLAAVPALAGAAGGAASGAAQAASSPSSDSVLAVFPMRGFIMCLSAVKTSLRRCRTKPVSSRRTLRRRPATLLTGEYLSKRQTLIDAQTTSVLMRV